MHVEKAVASLLPPRCAIPMGAAVKNLFGFDLVMLEGDGDWDSNELYERNSVTLELPFSNNK